MTLAEAKAYLRLAANSTANDAAVQLNVDTATDIVETRLDRALCTQTFEWSSDSFPSGPIQLSKEPVQSIVSLAYVDSEGANQVVDPGEYELNPGNRQVYRTSGEWPGTDGRQRSVNLTYVAGYGDSSNVPAVFKAAVLQLAARFFFDPAMEWDQKVAAWDMIAGQFMTTHHV